MDSKKEKNEYNNSVKSSLTQALLLQHPAPTPPSKEMMVITRHKTTRCQHFVSANQCPHELCTFSHGDSELRRNPFSPFVVSYGPNFVKEDPAAKESTNSINVKEFLYHPENYRTSFCSSTTLGKPCKEYPVCCFAHNSHELRHKYSGDSLAYFARYQQWDKLIDRLMALKETGFDFSTKFDTLLEQDHLYLLSKETWLHYVAKYGKWDILRIIDGQIVPLQRIDPAVWAKRDVFGQTMLMKACAFPGTDKSGQLSEGYIQTIEFLMAANPGAALLKDYEGHDIFYFAQKQTRSRHLRESLENLLRTRLLALIENIQPSPVPPVLPSPLAFWSSAAPVASPSQPLNSSRNQVPVPQSAQGAIPTRASTNQQSTATQQSHPLASAREKQETTVSILINKADYCCPITEELFEDPVLLLPTGQFYERFAIVDWLLENRTCPKTQAVITIEAARPRTGNWAKDIAQWSQILQAEKIIQPHSISKDIMNKIREADAMAAKAPTIVATEEADTAEEDGVVPMVVAQDTASTSATATTATTATMMASAVASNFVSNGVY
jgi:U-box domain